MSSWVGPGVPSTPGPQHKALPLSLQFPTHAYTQAHTTLRFSWNLARTLAPMTLQSLRQCTGPFHVADSQAAYWMAGAGPEVGSTGG